VDISIVAQTAYVLLRTRLDAAEDSHDHRPIRLWGHRPTRVAMAVGTDPAPQFSLTGYHALDAMPPRHDGASDRVAMRRS
jgi:hypothetical protein